MNENELNNIIYDTKSHFSPMGIMNLDDNGVETPTWVAESSEFGDAEAGKPGRRDIEEAARLISIIHHKFPDLSARWRNFGEFVQILVNRI